MAAAMTLMSKYRKGPFIQKQLLYYPVTNACFDTCSTMNSQRILPVPGRHAVVLEPVCSLPERQGSDYGFGALRAFSRSS